MDLLLSRPQVVRCEQRSGLCCLFRGCCACQCHTSLPCPSLLLRSSSKNNDDHKLAYEQFRDVSVWRRGMDCRVPLTLLLDAAGRK